jgi:hypothetical protein
MAATAALPADGFSCGECKAAWGWTPPTPSAVCCGKPKPAKRAAHARTLRLRYAPPSRPLNISCGLHEHSPAPAATSTSTSTSTSASTSAPKYELALLSIVPRGLQPDDEWCDADLLVCSSRRVDSAYQRSRRAARAHGSHPPCAPTAVSAQRTLTAVPVAAVRCRYELRRLFKEQPSTLLTHGKGSVRVCFVLDPTPPNGGKRRPGQLFNTRAWLYYEAGRRADLDLSSLTHHGNYAAPANERRAFADGTADAASRWWARAAKHAAGPARAKYYALASVATLLTNANRLAAPPKWVASEAVPAMARNSGGSAMRRWG